MASVNLSAKEFEQPNLTASVGEVLRKTGLYPAKLSLEITETMAMNDQLYCAKTLQELADLGVRLAIDDFGTGYSSLNQLKRFPLDYVKVDHSFVKDVRSVNHDKAILSSIIGLVRAFQMEAIAEGVETAEQCALLREMGCKMAQGYYFSKPLHPQAVPALLSTKLLSIKRPRQ